MKLPRDLPGEKLVRLPCREGGYEKVHQVGSHIILQTEEPYPHRMTIPAPKALPIGTLRDLAIHENVSREDFVTAHTEP